VTDTVLASVRALRPVPRPARRPARSVRQAAAFGGPAAALLVMLGLAVAAGLPWLAAARALLVVAGTQVLPGVLLWRLVRPLRGWWAEDVVAGFAVGTALAVATQAVAGTLGLGWLSLLAGPAVAIGLLVLPATRTRLRATTTEPLPWLWGPLVAVVALLDIPVLRSFYNQVLLSWDSGFRATYVDMSFHLALSAELAHHGPASMPFVRGQPLTYHWFSHAWVAQVAVASHTPIDAVLLRFLPALLAVVLPLAVAAVAVRVSGSPWAGPPAALFAAGAGSLDVFGLPQLVNLTNPLSPSLGLSTPVSLVLVGLLAAHWRGTARPGAVLLLAVLGFTAVGTKGSALPVVVAGVALAAGTALLSRSGLLRRILLDLAVLVGCLVAGIVVIFRGATQGLVFDPSRAAADGGLSRVVIEQTGPLANLPAAELDTVVVVTALTIGAGLLGVLLRRGALRDPVPWLLLGTGLAGALAIVLFSQVGDAQYYFLRNAQPVLAVGSGMGLVALAEQLRVRLRWRAVAVLAVGLALGLNAVYLAAGVRGGLAGAGPRALDVVLRNVGTFAAVTVAGGALLAGVLRRRRGDPPGLVLVGAVTVALCGAVLAPALTRRVQAVPAPVLPPVASTARFAISRDQIAAARWLRDHSSAQDVVMTNRHCAAPRGACDARRFVVSAYTERRVLVEGWAYSPAWAEQTKGYVTGSLYAPFSDLALLNLNDRFLARPEAADAVALRARGVRWVFLDQTVRAASSLAPFATLRDQTRWAQVWSLDPPR